MRSMTGYGAHRCKSVGALFLIEIHSVNRKNLDVNILAPKSLLCLDLEIRNWLKTDAHRGKISIKITNLDEACHVPALSDLETLLAKWKNIAQSLSLTDDISIEFLANQARYIEEKPINVADVEDDLKKGFMSALSQWNATRANEGKVIQKDIEKRVLSILPILSEIEKISFLTPNIYKERLFAKLTESDAFECADPERLAKEMTIYADRIDITEELVRLKAHMNSAQTLCEGKEVQVGRAFDF